ncbi:hypothetical protein [Kitasatospora sp. NPDC087271]|uniref:hypothetical protein n=1 Tax=Kitasatospora sp. NPDC087271 TaxID=3364067 RepID=UPI0038301A10
MIAEDTQPPGHGGKSRLGPGATSGTLHTAAVDPPAGTTGRQAATDPADGAQCAEAAPKPRMRGWLHAGIFPLSRTGGIVLIVLARPAEVDVASAPASRRIRTGTRRWRSCVVGLCSCGRRRPD